MVKTNQDIICERYIRNGDDVLAISDEDKIIVRKSYHERPLKLAWVGIVCHRQIQLVAYFNK